MEILVKKWRDLDEDERQRILKRSETNIASLEAVVRPILEKVKIEGDAALLEFTKRFDKVDLKAENIRVSEEEIEASASALNPELKSALEYAIENVRRFHEAQVPKHIELSEIREGILAGERARPIPSTGLYIPRGRGSFPSMLYMLAVPAALAGVEKICIVTPPGPDASVDPACLYAAELCGVREVYRIGGAQAIAALAYGTETVPKVSKVTGPGSSYVAAAKRLLQGEIDTGLPAGPSESIVLACKSADPQDVLLDLMVEAEHGSDSSAVLITPDPDLASKVAEELPKRIEGIEEPRRSFLREVFSSYGGIILVEDLKEGADLVNSFAPEHLQINTRDPFETMSLIKNAGEILLGSRTSFPLANYAVGANAVLPTGGNAKTWGPVSVRDFMKYQSVVYVSEKGYRQLKPHVLSLADYEGFICHAEALRSRKDGD